VSSFTIHQAKTNLSKLIKNACKGEEIIITRGSKPVARLVAVGEVRGMRRPGSLKGQLHVGPEFFEPLNAEEIDFEGFDRIMKRRGGEPPRAGDEMPGGAGKGKKQKT
jgi:prevent-host-death family protein